MKKFLLIMPVAAIMMAGCSDDVNDTKNNEFRPIELSRAEAQIAQKANTASWRLFGAVCNDDQSTDNVFFSPVSANFALSMLANGGAGETRQQIIDVIGIDSDDIADVNSYCQKIVSKTTSIDKHSKVSYANSLWTDPDIPVYPEYRNTLASWYDAESRELGPSFISDINSWCSSKTNGMIDRIMSDDASMPLMILLNATYFKGTWNDEYKFNKDKTKREKFTNNDGTQATVEMMNQSFEHMMYAYNSELEMCRLFFGNKAFSLTLILPDEGINLDQTTESLANGDWDELTSSLNGLHPGELKLPKFEALTNTDLIPVLRKLGMTNAFDTNADFSGISSVPMIVSMLNQCAKFRVDEEGADAAAVTKVEFELTSPGPNLNGKVNFYCDRPFMYVISENSTGAILFIGKMERF